MMNILIVQRDREIQKYLKKGLKELGYTVEICSDRDDAYYHIKSDNYDLAILDIDIENGNGIELCSEIREINKKIGIIFLSSENDIEKKVQSLDSGADDYITKPFNPLELIARVKSQLRRYMTLGNYVNVSKEDKKVIKSSGLEINLESKEVFVEGESIRVTATEFGILELLLKNKGRVFSIDEIYENVWKEPSYNAENTVAVHIRRIREKIEINPKEPKYLKVVWGIGYKIEKYE